MSLRTFTMQTPRKLLAIIVAFKSSLPWCPAHGIFLHTDTLKQVLSPSQQKAHTVYLQYVQYNKDIVGNIRHQCTLYTVHCTVFDLITHSSLGFFKAILQVKVQYTQIRGTYWTVIYFMKCAFNFQNSCIIIWNFIVKFMRQAAREGYDVQWFAQFPVQSVYSQIQIF